MVPGVAHWVAALGAVLEGRPAVATVPSLSAAGSLRNELASVGLTDLLFVGARRGSGPPDDVPVARAIDLGLAPRGILADVRALNRVLADPPARLRDAVERFDPDRRAIVLGDSFNEIRELCGRPFLAWRRPEWIALEDKLVVDAFWDRCGIPRAPSEVVGLDAGALAGAARRLDRGDGVVVAADAQAGWHGGADLVRRIEHGDAVDGGRRVAAAFAPVAASARVMPFVRGVPCSIHGIVLPDAVVVLRPVELLVLLGAEGRFVYTGTATFFDPPETDRIGLRAVARRVGETLRSEVGFRGAFTVDGVLGADGFVPTELNPRNGAGTRPLTSMLDLPFQLLLDAAVAGLDLDWRPNELETLLVGSADAHRTGSTHRQIEGRLPAESCGLVVTGGRVRRTAVGEPPDLRFEVLPADGAVTVRCTPVAGRIAIGPPFAPIASAFWNWFAQEAGLEHGGLTAPPPA